MRPVPEGVLEAVRLVFEQLLERFHIGRVLREVGHFLFNDDVVFVVALRAPFKAFAVRGHDEVVLVEADARLVPGRKLVPVVFAALVQGVLHGLLERLFRKHLPLVIGRLDVGDVVDDVQVALKSETHGGLEDRRAFPLDKTFNPNCRHRISPYEFVRVRKGRIQEGCQIVIMRLCKQITYCK
ncbi:MAG: hypothetical protein LUG50_13170 [Planctomycetaceae bacterium]|nr:hypothetical protein [Planctomycetaceae bacterium]